MSHSGKPVHSVPKQRPFRKQPQDSTREDEDQDIIVDQDEQEEADDHPPRFMSRVCSSLRRRVASCFRFPCVDKSKKSTRSQSHRLVKCGSNISNCGSNISSANPIKQQRQSARDDYGSPALKRDGSELAWEINQDFPILPPLPLRKPAKIHPHSYKQTQFYDPPNPNATKPPLPPSAILRRKQLQQLKLQSLNVSRKSRSAQDSSTIPTASSSLPAGLHCPVKGRPMSPMTNAHSKAHARQHQTPAPANSMTILPSMTSPYLPGGYREQFRRQLQQSKLFAQSEPNNSNTESGTELDKESSENTPYSTDEEDKGDVIHEETVRPGSKGQVGSDQLGVISEEDAATIRECSEVVGGWGKVNSLYIPIKGFIPTESGPKFPTFEKEFHKKKIESKHYRAKMNQKRLLRSALEARLKVGTHWKKRRLIGLFKRKLRTEKSMPNLKIFGELEAHFHHIHWFSNGKDKLNSVGRYFDMEDNRLVAIKIFGYGFASHERQRLDNKLSAMIEINALVQMDHVNIVQMRTYFELNAKIYLVMEPANHTLRSEIEKAIKGVHPKMVQGVMLQIMKGLEFCHHLNILHRDLSPENILVTSDGILKLADFNKSIQLGNELFQEIELISSSHPIGPGTVTYGAPELLHLPNNMATIGLKADIWSIGCILCELLRGVPVWNCPTETEQLHDIEQTFTSISLPDFPVVYKSLTILNKSEVSMREKLPKVSDATISFVLKCLEMDPKRRSTCQDLMEHPFLKLTPDKDDSKLRNQPMAEAILPKNDLYKNLRPHSAPLGATSVSDTSVPHSKHYFQNNSKCTAKVHQPANHRYECDVQDEESSSDENKGMDLTDQTISNTSIGSLFDNEREEDGDEEIPKTPKPKTATKIKCKKKKVRISRLNTASSIESDYYGGDKDDKKPSSQASMLKKWNNLAKRQKRKPSAPVQQINARLYTPGSRYRAAAASRQASWEAQNGGAHRNDADLPVSILKNKKSKTNVAGAGKQPIDADLPSSVMCVAHSQSEIVTTKRTPKEALRDILASVHQASWVTADIYSSQLKHLAKTSPRIFSEHVPALVISLIEQISISKSRIAGPAIKILKRLYDISPRSMDLECERVVAGMLGKLGGPLFIDTECMDILRLVVAHTLPVRACLALAKYGTGTFCSHRMGISRAAAARFLSDAVRKLNVKEECGDQTPTQRRLTNSLFDAATRFSHDANVSTRDSAREIYCMLLRHPDFWRLYLQHVPDVQRLRVNRLLDEIRRVVK